MYRLIDFPLSNCLHSDISDGWVIQQTHPESLTDHLSNGRPWDPDRTYGGLLVLHPRVGEKGGFHQGTADALWRNSDPVRRLAPDAVVVVSADAPYRLDHRDLAGASDADLIMVTTEVEPADAGRYGWCASPATRSPTTRTSPTTRPARVGADDGLTVTRRGTAVAEDAELGPEEKS